MLGKVCMKKVLELEFSRITLSNFENNESTYSCVFVLQKCVAGNMLVAYLSLK